MHQRDLTGDDLDHVNLSPYEEQGKEEASSEQELKRQTEAWSEQRFKKGLGGDAPLDPSLEGEKTETGVEGEEGEEEEEEEEELKNVPLLNGAVEKAAKGKLNGKPVNLMDLQFNEHEEEASDEL